MTASPSAISTVDMIIENEKGILLIKRRNPPFKDHWALPGGFLEVGKESLEEAAVRELEEETSLNAKIEDLVLVGAYSDPKRDPRGHVISHAYYAERYSGIAKAADDAKELAWFNPNNLPKLAFDHEKIIKDYQRQIYEKMIWRLE